MKRHEKDIFVPGRGDIIWLSFSPQKGHEQSGRRPAIVLTKHLYNERSGLSVVCPMTSRTKGYAFEVNVSGAVRGVALVDQIKSIDWRERGATFAGTTPRTTLEEISRIAADLISGK